MFSSHRRLSALCALTIGVSAWLAAASLARAVHLSDPDPTQNARIAEEFLTHLGSTETLTGLQSAGDLQIGTYVQTYAFSSAFNLKETTTELENEIVPVDEWMAPVTFNGTAVGGVVVIPDGTYWYVTRIMSDTELSQLLTLQAGDRVVSDAPLGTTWIARDNTLLPFDDVAQTIFPTGTSLEAYQTYHDDRGNALQALSTPGSPPVGAGAGMPATSKPVTDQLGASSNSAWWIFGAAALALVLGLAVVLTRQRS